MSKQRRGRPRKTGPRLANGHLKAPRDSPRAIAAAMPHRRGLGDHAVDPHAETELGRMLLRGEITATLALAGETYAHLWAGYVATLDAPQSLRSGDGHELHCRGCVSDHDRAHCLCAMRKRIYLEAADVLCDTAGTAALELVSSVVIHDRQCPFSGLKALNVGLSALAAHFGLTKPRNSWHLNAWSEL
jgi:hypothetical protein